MSARQEQEKAAAAKAKASLVEQVEKRRFVGRELLLWLWMESELFEATLETKAHGSFGLWLEKKLVLSAGEESTRIAAPLPGAGREAKEALLRGQLPEAAAIRIAWKDDETSLALHGESFAIRGLKLRTVLGGSEAESMTQNDLVDELAGRRRGKPKRKKQSEEEAAALAEQAAFEERMVMTRELEDLLATLYRDFLTLRLSPTWSAVVVPTMRAWAAGERVDADAYRAQKRGIAGGRAEKPSKKRR